MSLDHLVIVPCHGIWQGGVNGDDRNEWVLAPFQIEGEDHLCFKQHLLQAFDITKSQSNSLMIISGGKTKADTPLSEAHSYYQLLVNIVGKNETLARVKLEEYAKDSFENVLFLFCRFFEVAGRYPDKVTIVGFEFKRYRFLMNHLQYAMNFPLTKAVYIGNSPTPSEARKDEYFKELHQSEYAHAIRHFEIDFYGRRDPLLKKKISRNPYDEHHSYIVSNPLLAEFLLAIETDGPDETAKNALVKWAPW